MSYKITFKKEQAVLHLKATGTRTFEVVWAMAKEIMEACKKQGTTEVLIDVRKLKGRLSTLNSFEMASSQFLKLRDKNVLKAAAIVDLKEFKSSYIFFEDVAVNRGFNLRLFGDIDEELNWLK